MSKLCNGSFLVSAWPRKKQILVLHQAEYNDIIIVPSEPIIGQLAVHFKELQLVVSQVRTLPASLSICNKYGSAQELHSTFGHLKTFKIIQSFVKGLVGLDLVWSSLV